MFKGFIWMTLWTKIYSASENYDAYVLKTTTELVKIMLWKVLEKFLNKTNNKFAKKGDRWSVNKNIYTVIDTDNMILTIWT